MKERSNMAVAPSLVNDKFVQKLLFAVITWNEKHSMISTLGKDSFAAAAFKKL